jgi:hypothetical protein
MTSSDLAPLPPTRLEYTTVNLLHREKKEQERAKEDVRTVYYITYRMYNFSLFSVQGTRNCLAKCEEI